MGNNLTPAQVERLVKLHEELNEAGKEICKILLHGYDSRHPDGGPTNQQALQTELGDVCSAIRLLTERGDLDDHAIYVAAIEKDKTITAYMSHQGDANA
jgi:hypothetical protein